MTSKFRVTAACVPRQAAGLILACIATSAAADARPEEAPPDAPEPGNVQPDVDVQ